MDRLFWTRSKIDLTLFARVAALSDLPGAAETLARLTKIAAELSVRNQRSQSDREDAHRSRAICHRSPRQISIEQKVYSLRQNPD
ncbi:hypothetical protein M5E06_16585 [Azospirillum sp. A1-3]|uniref:hypothetical protein n=1 Tax=Azospirillum sp. A1-3 TaxID=185874 RepID=UPI002077297C|nr:hypothetical protein [Azospirillum sp. A1-3]MCM8735763.1 hypothetical protein [Azospirillum sp. A1-3]